MHPGRAVFVVWLCFMARAFFYSSALPLWEGFDEPAHFAVIQRMALRGEILVPRNSPVPRDVHASLELAPVPWEMRNLPSPSVTQDAYWRLPAEERNRREAQFNAIPAAWSREDSAGGLSAYEGLQPPLYGWLMAPALRVVSHAPLGDRVIWLRWLSAAIASLTIPLVFLIGRAVFRDDALALGCAVVVAVMPEFAIDVSRVGNECIAVVLFTLLTWMALGMVRSGLNHSRALCMGATLGLGLLAKAYFLAALPALAALLAYELWRARGRRRTVIVSISLGAAITALIAGWWYVRNLLTTATWSGLSEAVTLREMSAGGMLQRVGEVPWRAAIDSILFSHIWFGGWSFLMVRSWMYHVFYVLILVAAIGLLRVARQPAILVLLAIYASFWAGQLYNVLLLFLSKGIATSMGWYMYTVIGAEVALCVAGLRALLPARWNHWPPTIGVFLFALLDLYTVHAVAIPYYTGMIAHKANGAIAALHFADVSTVGLLGTLQRLAGYKGTMVTEPLLLTLWLAYMASTILLVVVSMMCHAARPIPLQQGNSRGLHVGE
jgi:hypothetical protein